MTQNLTITLLRQLVISREVEEFINDLNNMSELLCLEHTITRVEIVLRDEHLKIVPR